MNDLFGFVSVIVLGCGAYTFYAYFQMKKTGHINETLLLGRNYSEFRCKNKQEFLEKSLPAVLVLAIACVLYGVIDLIHCYVTPIKVLDLITGILFFAVLVGYMVYTTKLKKQYF